MPTSDEQIKKDVVDQFYWDDSVDASKVLVEVNNGQVTLTGKVPSLSAKRAAETDASIVTGVVSVKNDIIVECPPVVPKVSDGEIKSRTENVLRWNADMEGEDIRVSVKEGWVTLEGNVSAYWKKMRAEDLASDLLGITGITNALAVVPTKSVTDKAIAQDIMAALERNTNINVDTVDVKVEDGVVTLSGTVTNWVAYEAASSAARYTTGVINMVNNLTIG